MINRTNKLMFLSQDENKIHETMKMAINASIKEGLKSGKTDTNNIRSQKNMIVNISERLNFEDNYLFKKEFVEKIYSIYLIPGDSIPNNKGKELIDSLLSGIPKISYKSTIKYMSAIKFIVKIILVILRKERLILLPLDTGICSLFWNRDIKNVSDLLPVGIDFYPIIMKELFKKQKSIKGSVSWGETRFEKINGKENYLSSALKICQSSLVDNIDDLNEERILEIIKPSKNLTSQSVAISFILTFLVKNSTDEEKISQLYDIVYKIPRVTIDTPEYFVGAKRYKENKSYKRRKAVGKIILRSDLTEDDIIRNKNILLDKQRDVIENAINFSISNGKINYEDLMANLAADTVRNILNPNSFPEKTMLPSFIKFDWKNSTKKWNNSFRTYISNSNNESEKTIVSPISVFWIYLYYFLPIWFHYNKDNKVLNYSYPKEIDEFKGAYYITRLEGYAKKYLHELALPPSFGDFVTIVAKVKKSGKYNKVGLGKGYPYAIFLPLRKYFEYIEGKPELFGYDYFKNPILDCDMPRSYTRNKTVNVRLPQDVYWLMLMYCNKIYEVVREINKGIIEGRIYKNIHQKWKDSSKKLRDSNKEYFLLLHVDEIKELINIDFDLVFEGKKYSIKYIPMKILMPTELVLKPNKVTPLIHPGPIIQIIVALETGLRHQSIQWLSTEFDSLVKDKMVIDTELYYLLVDVDKVKKKAWTPAVNGRVINILRELKDFRESLGYDELEDEIAYEDRDKSKFPDLIPLFSYLSEGTKHGRAFPHSDKVYSVHFDSILVGLQEVFDDSDINYNMYSIREDGAIDTDIDPHATRVTVVSELLTFLPPEYISEEITGQSVPTIAYYNKLSPEQLNSYRNIQAKFFNQLKNSTVELHNKESSEEVDFSNTATIDTFSENSRLVQAFKSNAKEALVSFGSASATFSDIKSGVDIVMSHDDAGESLKFAFEKGFICPYNLNCPRRIIKAGLEKRCCIASCAIRTIDHLPVLSGEKRTILEKLRKIKEFVTKNKDNLTDGELLDFDIYRKHLAEDCAGLTLAEEALNYNLNNLKNGKNPEDNFFAFDPDAITQDICPSDFPSYSDGDKYLIGRLKELSGIPSLQSPEMLPKFMRLRQKILINSGNFKDVFKDVDSNDCINETYGIVKSIMKFHNYSIHDIVEITNKDVSSMYDSKHLNTLDALGVDH